MEFIYNEEEKKFYLPDNSKTYEDFFKKLEIKEKMICVDMNGTIIRFAKNSKKIKFIGNGHNEDIFITNKNQILYILDLFHFKKYKIKKKQWRI